MSSSICRHLPLLPPDLRVTVAFVAAAALVVVLQGCRCPLRPIPGPEVDTQDIRFDPPPTSDQRESRARVIRRVQHPDQCADVAPKDGKTDGVWKCRPLGALLKKTLVTPPQGPLDPAPGRLADFCLCEFEGPAEHADASRFDDLVSGDLDVVGSNPLTISPLTFDVALMLHQVYWQHVLGFDLKAAPKPQTQTSKVAIAVVDSALEGPQHAKGWPGSGQFEHGPVMGTLARELSCQSKDLVDPGCSSLVASHLALDLEVKGGKVVKNLALGGYFGWQTTLAERIFEAVRRWKLDKASKHLVINLSVAWETLFTTNPKTGDLYGGAAAVRAALEEAACAGALVIAAAGNDSGGTPAFKGAKYPGAWMDPRRGGGFVQCHGVPTPLLWAVGGVDNEDWDIAATRPAGRPPLVVPSFYALADRSYQSPGATGFSVAMTGTSVSAAIASGLAALVWGYLPDASAADVMQLVYDSAVAIPDIDGKPQQADLCLEPSAPGGCPVIRRLDTCGAVRAAVTRVYGADAASKIVCKPRPAHAGANPQLSAQQVATMGSASTHDGSTLTHQPALSGCGGTRYYSASATPTGPDPCPEEQHYQDVGLTVNPQPTSPGCSVCSTILTGLEATTYINVNPRLTGPLTSVTLKLIRQRSGYETYSLSGSLPPAGLAPGSSHVVERLPVNDLPNDPFTQATLSSMELLPDGSRVLHSEQILFQR